MLVIFCSVQVLFAQNANENLTIEPYVFENSKKEKVKAEFGRLKVPENRKKRNGKTIELAFVRFKSTSNNPGSPTIYLAGGPGGSGIGTARGSRFPLFMAMRQFGDVIAFDQRGTGDSKPNLRCSGRLDMPLDKALTREIFIKAESEGIKKCAEEWANKGVDASAYNTVESANDINDLRIALGARKINLWGISYGTHLSLATIRQHGKYIDKVIFAGVEGTDDTLKLPSYTQNLLIELDKRVRADANIRVEVSDLLGLINKVLKRLEVSPVTVEVQHPRNKEKAKITIGKFDVQILTAGFSGSNEFQASIPILYKQMEGGDFSFVAGQMMRLRKGRVSSLMSVSMDCASGVSRKRTARINREKGDSLVEDVINSPFPEICSSINNARLGKRFRKAVKSKVPSLFISGTLDGRTPVSNAEFVQKGFKNSTHLVIDGAGHSDPLFLSSPKIKETMISFMAGEKLPSRINIQMAKPFKFVSIKD